MQLARRWSNGASWWRAANRRGIPAHRLREHERTGAPAACAPIDGQDAAILRPCRPRQQCNEYHPIHAMDHPTRHCWNARWLARPTVTSIEGLQKIGGLAASHLAHHDVIGPVPQCVPDQLPDGDGAPLQVPRLEAETVGPGDP